MLNKKKVIPIIKQALAEDIGRGDVTTRLVVPSRARVKAEIIVKQKAVICGMEVLKWVFAQADSSIRFKALASDGARVKPNKKVALLEGPAKAILTAERTALNFLGYLSGISTLTSCFVEKAGPGKVKIVDTRKTLPGLRYLAKYAVRTGGGFNHRMGLYDQILLKDNHLKIAGLKLRIKGLIKKIKNEKPKNMKLEIEVKNLKEFREALEAQPDIIMLDNMKLTDIRKMIKLGKRSKQRPLIEVSGNVSLKNVSQIAKVGPDIISIGSLTHSVESIDVSLNISNSRLK